tara:strand:+ start:1683 stop:2171 length:489 start_codon:yes stop_codon:yes gene_type:complete
MSRLSAYNAGTMTVTVAEALTLNNKDYGSTQTFSIASIANVSRRLVTVTTTEAVVMTMNASAMGAGQHIDEKVKYLRFTNLDDTNFITLTFRNQDNDEVAIKLEQGKSFIWAGDDADGMNLVMNATQDADAASSTNFGSLTNVQADADTASCDLEIFVAETA